MRTLCVVLTCTCLRCWLYRDAATAKAVVQRAVSCTGVLGEPVQAGAASTSGGSQQDSKPQGWMEKFLLHCKSECVVDMVVGV